MTNGEILQDLRSMTVQIRRAQDDAIVGTGVAISAEGKIITCAHVVRAAGVEPREAHDAQIGVYFPQARGGETKARLATIAACFPQHDDDIVLLQLVVGASPLAPEQIAVLGKADASRGNPFESFGYCPLGHYPSSIAKGQILGFVDPPKNESWMLDPVQLESANVDKGMSGAAVLDVNAILSSASFTKRIIQMIPQNIAMWRGQSTRTC